MSILRHFFLSWQKPAVKNLVNFIFWFFILFGIYFLTLAREPDWEYPRFQGFISLLSAFFILLPYCVYRSTRLRHWYEEYLLYISEALVAIPLALNGLGALYFFDVPWGFDSFLHFTSSTLAVLFIFFILGAFWRVDTLPTRIILFFIAVVSAFTAGIGMEGWEVFSDKFFGTRSWGDIWQHPWDDTRFDIFYDVVGSGIGGVIVFFLGKRWLIGLRRIVPQMQEKITTSVTKLKEINKKVRRQVKGRIADSALKIKKKIPLRRLFKKKGDGKI